MNGVLSGVACGLLACVGAVGCGGDSTHHLPVNDAGTSGVAAAGGSGGSSQGGGGSSPMGTSGTSGTSDIATPPAVGLSISLGQPHSDTIDFGGRSCTAGSSGAFTYTLGKPAPGGTITSGMEGVTVTCTITAAGAVSAQISGLDSNTQERLSLNFSGTLDKTAGATSLAFANFYSPETLGLSVRTPFPDCTVGPITTLKTGAVLTDFSCPILSASDDTTSGCAANGTLALEYCLSGAEAP